MKLHRLWLPFVAMLMPVWPAVAEEGRTGPVFFFDDGRFETRGYECWDLATIWKAVPEKLRPYAWVALWVAPENIYSKESDPSKMQDFELVTPSADPNYAAKDAALEKALCYADAHGINVILGVRRYAKSLAAAASYTRVDEALAKHRCVRGFAFDELGACLFTDVDQEHLVKFCAIAKRHGAKVFWAIQMAPTYKQAMWNFLMADPKWFAFLREHRETLVPTFKTVEALDCMLNWADCVGMWLGGTSEAWGLKFDPCYWASMYGRLRIPDPANTGAGRAYRATIFPRYWSDQIDPFVTCCPQYLVKDSMILSALTGCKYFQFLHVRAFWPAGAVAREGRYTFWSPEDRISYPGGSLRSVWCKTAAFIVARKLWRTKEEVQKLARVAAESPSDYDAVYRGYTYTNRKRGPNVLWKNVFGIPDAGVDLVPNDGRHYIVPVIAPGAESGKAFQRVLKPEEVAHGDLVRRVLDQYFPQRFSATDANVLIFDAGEVLYVTDSREENRSTLDFTFESKVPQDYRCTILAEDGTPCDVQVATEKLPGGWRKKFVLFAGCSAILERKSR